jgi:hypothetical protein
MVGFLDHRSHVTEVTVPQGANARYVQFRTAENGKSRCELRHEFYIVDREYMARERKRIKRIPPGTWRADACEVCGSVQRNKQNELLHFDEECFK